MGRVARELPQLVKQAAEMGHEIASHSFEHRRVFGLNRHVFKEQLKASKDFLQSLTGLPVYGFRAPDFSITQASLWALDVLKELGFAYDSSIYPIGLHDVYGIRDVPRRIHRLPNGLVEFPLSTLEFFGRRLPFGGGGYFRLYPLYVTHQALLAQSRRKHPCMFYMHPYEIGPVIPRIAELSPLRRFRHYYNCGTGYERLKKLLGRHRFGPAVEVLKQNNFWAEN
ncbi:MAG: polysaccharide deacetylase family protein [Limisphaerales bacterium]